MSISIYYRARRSTPLTRTESEGLAAIEREFSVDSEVENYLEVGAGLNWESFTFYEGEAVSGEDVILEGATKLPDNTDDAIMTGLVHWTHALANMRRLLHDAVWQVSIEDHELSWNEAMGEYDIST